MRQRPTFGKAGTSGGGQPAAETSVGAVQPAVRTRAGFALQASDPDGLFGATAQLTPRSPQPAAVVTHAQHGTAPSQVRTQARVMWQPVDAAPKPQAQLGDGSQPPKSRPWRVAIVSFFLGAVCWHFVGFWSFMTEIVQPSSDPFARSAATTSGKPAPKGQDSLVRDASKVAKAEARACVELVLDRRSNETKSVSCKPIIRGTMTASNEDARGSNDDLLASRSARLTIPLRIPVASN